MSNRESSMLRSLVSWHKTREVSPAPLSASPKDSALESIQEDSKSAQLLGAKVRVNTLLDHPLTQPLLSPAKGASAGGDSIHCACHEQQPDTTNTKIINKLLLACMLASFSC